MQVFVAGLQLVPPHTASSATVHWTHSPAGTSQTVVPVRCAQSSFVWQGLQLPASQVLD